MTILLTEDQQKQIKDATGKDMTELYMHFSDSGELSEKELGKASGGTGIATTRSRTIHAGSL